MSSRHTGSCLCSAVTFEISGEFEKFFLCHCSRCRKFSGTAHASNLFSSDAHIFFADRANWDEHLEEAEKFNQRPG